MNDYIELAKLYLQKWFNGTTIKSRGNKISIKRSGGSVSISGFDIETFTDDKNAEPFEVEDAINKVLTPKLEQAVKDIFTDDLIHSAMIEANVYSTTKQVIGKAIKTRVERDARAIVNEALDDLEDNYEITSAVKTFVINKIKGIFK